MVGLRRRGSRMWGYRGEVQVIPLLKNVFDPQVVVGWIGWPEEKGFKDVEGIEERFK